MLEFFGLCIKLQLFSGNNPKVSAAEILKYSYQITIEIAELIATSYHTVYQEDVLPIYDDHRLKSS